MKKRKTEVFLAGIAMVFLLAMVAVNSLIATDPPPRDVFCSVLFPTLNCPNGSCTVIYYTTGYCYVNGCVQDPGWIVCY